MPLRKLSRIEVAPHRIDGVRHGVDVRWLHDPELLVGYSGRAHHQHHGMAGVLVDRTPRPC